MPLLPPGGRPASLGLWPRHPPCGTGVDEPAHSSDAEQLCPARPAAQQRRATMGAGLGVCQPRSRLWFGVRRGTVAPGLVPLVAPGGAGLPRAECGLVLRWCMARCLACRPGQGPHRTWVQVALMLALGRDRPRMHFSERVPVAKRDVSESPSCSIPPPGHPPSTARTPYPPHTLAYAAAPCVDHVPASLCQ